MKKDYLKVIISSRGEVDGIEWLNNKDFEEIKKISREDWENNIEGEDEDYVEEYCNYEVNEGVCVLCVNNEEEYDIYINGDYVEEVKELSDYIEDWSDEEYEKFKEIICEFEYEYFKF